ncbi:MAG: asparagine synthase (glutamine-hydrolyzing) [Bryobacteraceae bacterium]|nr:asparagine synthase (glutamine-hydrolyzing) [Bryobacteraceae bacterium]
MCGIAGFVRREGAASLDLVQAMNRRIVHRGPDDEGYHVSGRCAIGMRRLSIIDLSGGHQPIANEDESVWVVFNGEIYNYLELRDFLLSRGHRLRTHSDTETLVHLWEEEGPDFVSRLRGMFAFAIWDERKQRLFVARDRFGKKPLYFANLSHGFYFGSELKCLRTAGVPLEIDEDALRLYFQFSYIPDPKSVFKDIRKVAPGGWMLYEPGAPGETPKLREGRYWTMPRPAENPPVDLTEDQAARELADLFDESVRIRLMADVPLGAFLSGGIDSSLVVASMARQTSEPVKTFSIGFEEAEFNELPYAETIARQYGTDHQSAIVKPDVAEIVPRLVDLYDEPFGDSSAIPTYVVSQYAVQKVKVCLTGDGGDELFAGYDTFFEIEKLRWVDAIPGPIRRLIGGVARALPYEARGKNYLRMIGQPTALDRYFEQYTPSSLLERLLQPKWLPPFEMAYIERHFPGCLLADPKAATLTQAIYFEATAKLTGDMLTKVDRASMGASLEVRCPLLDHKLAEFAARLPHSWKMKDGKGKQILLKALGDRLPPELIHRKKQGFGVPLAHWFRGALKPMLNDLVLSDKFLGRGIVQPEFVRYLIDEHQRGRRDNYYWLWRLLFLELWFRNLEAERPAA